MAKEIEMNNQKEINLSYKKFSEKREELLEAADLIECSMNYLRAELTKLAEDQIGVVGHTVLDTLSDMEQECSHYLLRGLSSYKLFVKELTDLSKFTEEGGELNTPFYTGREFKDYSIETEVE